MEQPQAPQTGKRDAKDPNYEVKVVSMMFVGFALISLDRFIIYPLFPIMSKDLGLDYADLGLISAATALTWGLSSFFAGNLADRIGGKTVLVGSAIVFSAMVAFTGLAGGLISLLILRALLGAAEGAFVPPAITETMKSSNPKRLGRNFGMVQMAQPLVGLGVAPIIAVYLLKFLPSWHWVFGVVAIPGFVLAYFMYVGIKSAKPGSSAAPVGGAPANAGPKPSFLEAFKYRNVRFGALAMTSLLLTMMVQSTFAPNFLIDYIGVPMETMGFLVAAIGVGGLAGMAAFPTLSDKYGRKRTITAALVLQFIGTLYLISASSGSTPIFIAMAFFCNAMSVSGITVTLVGPIINTSVPRYVAATATGAVVGTGEILGGAGGPALAGFLSNTYGIQIVPMLMLCGVIVSTLTIIFGIVEPKPNAAGDDAPKP
ncbi:MAG: MFS transporter [Pseudomonadota bacterium]